MYTSFYHLNEKPFQINTDPKFLWLGEKHKEALAVLKVGLIDQKGFLLLTGDVGTGKTTLVNALLESLDKDVLVASFTDPNLDLMGFLNYIARAFNIPGRFETKEDFLFDFRDFLMNTCLHNDKLVLLIIDEAHKLSKELLEQVRLLSNIEMPEKKLINIFLVGQNELNKILMTSDCRALRQRITLNYNIKPLSANETRKYIKHRLQVAGTDEPIFSTMAIQEIYRVSDGSPRLINVICDRALLTAYGRGQNKVTQGVILECAQEVLLPGERRFCSFSDVPQPSVADSPPTAGKHPPIEKNDTVFHQYRVEPSPATSVNFSEIINIFKKIRAKCRQHPALKPKIEKFVKGALMASTTFGPKGKRFIYGIMIAFVIAFAIFFSSPGYNRLSPKPDPQKTVRAENRSKARVEKEQVLPSGPTTPLNEHVRATSNKNRTDTGADGGKEKLPREDAQTDSQNAVVYYNLGKLYEKEKDYLRAVEAFSKAAKLDPNSAGTFFNLGFSHAAMKNYVEAEKMFLRASELKPSYLDKAIVNLALVQYKQGKHEQCLKNLEKALEVNPANQRAQAYLERFRTLSGAKP